MITNLFERDWQTLSVELKDCIATVTLNRPDKLNAMSQVMRSELGDFFLDCAREEDVRCLVLTGAGKAFSAGGDINDFEGTPEQLHELMGRVSHRWYKALWALPQPVIAAVNGVAAGGGCNLALGCDLVIASETASFAQTFLKIGLVPDLGGAYTLPRLVGLHRAKELALLGDRISAAEAHEMGMINRVVTADRLMDEVEGMAHRLAEGSPKAITLTKRMLNRSLESSMESILDSEWMAQSFLFGTEASRRGVDAFLSKSKKS